MNSDIFIYSDHNLLSLSLVNLINNKTDFTTTIISMDDLMNCEMHNNKIVVLNLVTFNQVGIMKTVSDFLELNPQAKIILLCNIFNLKFVQKTFELGVKAYLGNLSKEEELLKAIQSAKTGDTYINSEAKNIMIDILCNVRKENVKSDMHDNVTLTMREQEILLLIADGLSSKEVANCLFISNHTVDTHRRNIMQKLNINSTSKLIKYVYDNNLFLIAD